MPEPETTPPAVPVPELRDQIAGAQPAYDAVYAYIRGLGDYLPPDPVHRNAIIWRAVQAALGVERARQEAYENDVVGRFNQQATVDRRRAETAEATVERVRDALAQCHGWGETGDAYYAAIRTALTPPVPADQPNT